MTPRAARRYLVRAVMLVVSWVLLGAAFLLLVVQNDRHPAVLTAAVGCGTLGVLGWVLGLADSWLVAIRSRTTTDGPKPWFGFGGSVAEEQVRQSGWKLVDESCAVLEWDGGRVRALLRSSVLLATGLVAGALVLALAR